MSVRRFSSESYPDGARRAAWQDVLAVVGLRADPASATWDAHATAVLRGAPDGLTVARLAADRQVLSPLSRPSAAPLVLVPLTTSC